ncbi:MD-2-related lipid-recognition protein [Aphomia sociella]
MDKIAVVVFVAICSTVYADIARFTSCNDENSSCTINELRIDPCRSRNGCILKKGTDVSMSFDYTADFEASKLKTAVYWADTNAIFPDLGIADGCEYTTCPVVSGQKGTFNYHMNLGKKLPNGKYIIKWVLWNEENPSQQCCLKTPIQIKK